MTLSMPQLSDSMCYIITVVKDRETNYESHLLKGDALKAMRVHLENDAQVSISKEIDQVHYLQRKALYALYLAAIRATEEELSTIRARAESCTNKLPHRIEYRAVAGGSVPTNLLAKLQVLQADQLRSMKMGYAHHRMMRAVAMQPRIVQIKMLKEVIAHWPEFDATGKAILPADPAIVQGDITALTLEVQREREYIAQAEAPVQPELEMIEWDKVLVINQDGRLNVEEITKQVNMILYTPPVSIGDTRLAKHIERLANRHEDDALDHQLTSTGTLDLSAIPEGAIA